MAITSKIASFIAAAVTIAFCASAAQAQSYKVQVPGTSTGWYNSYASDAYRPKPVKPKPKPYTAAEPYDRPNLGVKRPYHRGYYGKVKPRRHVYTRPRRNIRGYANAPWNR